MNTHKNILKQVSLLIKKSDEISRLKGEKFNIFSVLRNETEEVTTHNRLIAEFLNPKGSHGMGSVFLNLFYDTIYESETCNLTEDKKEVLRNIRNLEPTVKAEEWLGKVDLKKVEGGSVDVCIKTNGGQIRIENKINAGDQNMQIARYCSRHNQENNIVIYLTKYGKDASPESKQDQKEGVDYFLLSHYSDTINWLEKCYHKATEFPILRETIKQYIILMKKVTNQHTSQEMKEELLDLITNSKENYRAAQEISTSLQEAEKRVMDKLLDSISSELKSKGYHAIDSIRGVRKDGGFIKIISLSLKGVDYDIGINLELLNQYFFFCAVEVGKKRGASINNYSRFDKIANYLEDKVYSYRNNSKRVGYNLNGSFKLNIHFSIENYLNLKKVEQQKFTEEVFEKLAKTIEESEIETYLENL